MDDDLKTLLIRWAEWKEALDRVSYPVPPKAHMGSAAKPGSRPLRCIPCSEAIEIIDKAINRMPQYFRHYIFAKFICDASVRDIHNTLEMNWYQQKRTEEDIGWWVKGYLSH